MESKDCACMSHVQTGTLSPEPQTEAHWKGSENVTEEEEEEEEIVFLDEVTLGLSPAASLFPAGGSVCEEERTTREVLLRARCLISVC